MDLYKHKTPLLLVLLTSAFILAPVFIVRAAVTLSIIAVLAESRQSFARRCTFLFLLMLFLFAYVYSPYWSLFSSQSQRILCLAVLIASGAIWAYYASDNLNGGFRFDDKRYLAALALILYLVNYAALYSDISWKGDEEFHMKLSLVQMLKHAVLFYNEIYWLLLLMAALLLYYLLASQIKDRHGALLKWAFITLAIVLFSILILPPTALPPSRYILRYPFLLYWPIMSSVAPFTYDVSLFRLMPFLSTVLMSWFLFYKFKAKTDKNMSLLLSLAFTTAPLIYFYTSLTYLEMPMILLMTICAFDIDAIVASPPKKLTQTISWYCLLAISLMKETGVILISLIIAMRLIYRLLNSKPTINGLTSEAKTYALMLFPGLIFLFFRSYLAWVREYMMQIYTLLTPETYPTLINALLNQLGILFILGIAGLIADYVKNAKTRPLFLASLMAGLMVFFLADSYAFIGYSRWNLYITPMLFYLAYLLITSANRTHQVLLVATIFLSNYALSPIYSDGSRQPNWGSPTRDNAEYTYPYDETIKWLSEEGNTKRLLIVGHYFTYFPEFYMNKYGFNPEYNESLFGKGPFNESEEHEKIREFFGAYGQKTEPNYPRVDTIIYHSVNSLDLDESADYGGFRIIKKIENRRQRLYIMRRNNAG